MVRCLFCIIQTANVFQINMSDKQSIIELQVTLDTSNASGVPQLTQFVRYMEGFVVLRFAWLDPTVSVASETVGSSEDPLHWESLYRVYVYRHFFIRKHPCEMPLSDVFWPIWRAAISTFFHFFQTENMMHYMKAKENMMHYRKYDALHLHPAKIPLTLTTTYLNNHPTVVPS